jgi:hypothetical protein
MNKFKERAINIVDYKEPIKHFDVLRMKETTPNVYMFFIEAMCQLAEEVEIEGNLKTCRTINELTNGNLYTKKEVEELLQKQRELCYEKHYLERYVENSYCQSYGEKEMPHLIQGNTRVNKNSILNAKLEI